MADHKRVTRLVYGLYIAGVAAFVASCIWQVARAVFTSGAAHQPSSAKVEYACGEGLKELMAGVDFAMLGALYEDSADVARRRYAEARDGKWSRRASIEETCTRDPNGKDALAALARYDRAAEATVLRHAGELTPVRNQAQSFISGHPR